MSRQQLPEPRASANRIGGEAHDVSSATHSSACGDSGIDEAELKSAISMKLFEACLGASWSLPRD